jgi:hypothetical protein
LTLCPLMSGEPPKAMLKIVLICLLACLGVSIGAYAIFHKAPEFDHDVIEGLKSRIREETSRAAPGVSVTEVSMIRESARKAIGFVKYRRDGQDITMNCTAIMEEGSYQINLDCR